MIPALCLCIVAATAAAAPQPVSLSQDENSFTLDNGIVTARVSKRSGDLVSLKFKDLQMLDADDRGRSYGYWSHDALRGERSTRITIDPTTNAGERGEVSVKGIANGRPMGNGPGGSVIADIEIRYALGRGDSAVYTYCTFHHPTNYPGTSVGEARFCAKLNDAIFDWMTVDSNRNMRLITAQDWNYGTVMNFKEARRMNTGAYKGQVEHKYDYSANQFETLAWGWSSSERNVGIWFINPTTEYLSGGPTKVELSAHRDATFGTNTTAPAPPCLLNYWRSSHYGGSVCTIGTNEDWTKVVGPFLIYCNSGNTPDSMWKDALKRSSRESKAWPYDWVKDVDYPHRSERGTVLGRLVLNDPQAPKLAGRNLLVGLSAPEYTPPRVNRGFGGFGPGGGGEDDSSETNRVNTPSDTPSPDRAPGSNATITASISAAPDAESGTATNSFGRGRRGRGGRGGPGGFGGFGFGPRVVDWQNDARYYQFWVRGDSRGDFEISNVRPGVYTLHAIADGVLGEFTLTNVTVKAGGKVDLGKMDWRPVRHGKQLWDIGIANRKASEFFKGDDYFHWGWYLDYPKLFPQDVNYTIGRSDFRRDWFLEQVPHNEEPTNTTARGTGRSTTWSITYDVPSTLRGRATLRLAICGIGTRAITVDLNGQSVGEVTGLFYNATINRDGIQGTWTEKTLAFDASLMKQGTNVLKLTIPAGGLTSGIMYDYLRLEVDQSASPPPKVTASATN